MDHEWPKNRLPFNNFHFLTNGLICQDGHNYCIYATKFQMNRGNGSKFIAQTSHFLYSGAMTLSLIQCHQNALELQ